jgi:hypothetical protein
MNKTYFRIFPATPNHQNCIYAPTTRICEIQKKQVTALCATSILKIVAYFLTTIFTLKTPNTVISAATQYLKSAVYAPKTMICET